MVEEHDAEPSREPLQLRRRRDVGLAGRRISRRMVVGDDDFLRARLQRLAEDRARVDRGSSILMPDRNENRLGKNLAVRIERQHEHALFPLLLRQRRPEL